MKELRDILGILAAMVVELLYAMEAIYIADKDAAKSPFSAKIEPKLEPERVERPETVVFNYGVAKPGEVQEVVEYVESVTVNDDATEWDIRRWNGDAGSPDFSAWDATDEEVIRAAKLSDATRKTYEKVRPYVVQGLTNTEIEARTGLSDGTVKKYAKLVRMAFKKRLEKLKKTSSPA